ALSSVRASLLTWKRPASSTLKMNWVRSGGGGWASSSGVGSSGTRTASSFSMSGVSTMKMMSSTRTMSTSGVMLMSERGPFFAPTSMPIACAPLLVLDLFRGELDALQLRLRGAIEHRPHVRVLGLRIRLDHHPLPRRGSLAHHGHELLGRRRRLLALDVRAAVLRHADEERL